MSNTLPSFVEQLHDIHLPPPVSWWPPAPGWWVLAILMLGLCVGFGIWQWQRFRRTAFRRMAMAEWRALEQAFEQGADPLLTVQALSRLLRRVARVIAPNQAVVAQTGNTWLAFLDRSGCTGEFTRGPGKILATWPYLRPDSLAEEHPKAKVRALLRLAAIWIQRV